MEELFLSLLFRRYDDFSSAFTLLLPRKEAILTKSSLICESSDKKAPTCKFLVLNTEVILTYLPVKNIFFTFYKRDSATFKLLNYSDRISLISYKKHLNDKLKKWIKNIKITPVFCFTRKGWYNCRGADVFSNIVEVLLLLYYTSTIFLILKVLDLLRLVLALQLVIFSRKIRKPSMKVFQILKEYVTCFKRWQGELFFKLCFSFRIMQMRILE